MNKYMTYIFKQLIFQKKKRLTFKLKPLSTVNILKRYITECGDLQGSSVGKVLAAKTGETQMIKGQNPLQ